MPAWAAVTSCICVRSTRPIHAILNWPSSTATRQASRNSSSRWRTRTIRVLMPLSMAYTRLSRLILCSASRRSVMSSPRAAMPVTRPSTERSMMLFQFTSRRSPERVTIWFS